MSEKPDTLTGAAAVLETLSRGGVRHCFSNPGTSEMHFVAALAERQDVRGVLCLDEGVATGAADGYGRIATRPAATLLHLGPGLANGLSNLHNARRARSPVVNIVGDHASYHLKLDAPLTSDIEGFARPVSKWVGRPDSAVGAAAAARDALEAAMGFPCGVATMILPADAAWSGGAKPVNPGNIPPPPAPPAARVRDVAELLKTSDRAALLIGGNGLGERGLRAAGRIRQATGCRLLAATFSTRICRGAGRVGIERLPYLAEQAMALLKDIGELILIGAPAPVSFFAYPGKPSFLTGEETALHDLTEERFGAAEALVAIADELGAPDHPGPLTERGDMPAPNGSLTPVAVGASVARHLPEGAIVSDEAITCGMAIQPVTKAARPHDWLEVMGGSIGQGLPLAVGAAFAAPDRKVVALEADGSAMYTIQALWTMARYNLDVTVVLLANRSYRILNLEYMRVAAGVPDARARELLDIDNPELEFTALARGMGVEAARAETAEAFEDLFADAAGRKGPFLIEAVVDDSGLLM